MTNLTAFISLLSGTFDNRAQWEEKKQQGESDFVFAKHVNTVCNHKIQDLPTDFYGIFLLEESYYTTQGKTNPSHHLFLFTETEDGILLTSYEIPDGYQKTSFTYENLGELSYHALSPSPKFTPALYRKTKNGWEGGSVSQFSPVMRFTLWERFSAECLEVSEVIEINGKRVFGFDEPILYRRCEN